MIDLVTVLNILVVCGMIVTAILACHFENLLSAVIALGATGLFAGAEFLILQAPDVAISEVAVGVALVPLVFVVALRKINKGGKDK